MFANFINNQDQLEEIHNIQENQSNKYVINKKNNLYIIAQR